MSDIAVIPEIALGEWPEAFSNGWISVFYDEITGDTVACLYFNNIHEESSVIELDARPTELPDAYISWVQDGTCKEIYVSRDHRRKGIGTMLCGWARSYLLQSDVVFHAPQKMTESAQLMFHSISENYGEPYTDPFDAPPTIPYGYWGGYLV